MLGPHRVLHDERAAAPERLGELLAGLLGDGHRRRPGQRQEQHPDAELAAPERPGDHEERPDRRERKQDHDGMDDERVCGDPVDGEHGALKRESGVTAVTGHSDRHTYS